MAEKSMEQKLSIGQRVQLTSHKTGILRYCGLVSFAPGVWCGIELDEADGNNDGSVDNVSYFSCEKNCGLFCQASEILNDLSLQTEIEDQSSECPRIQHHDLFADSDGICKDDSENSNESGRSFNDLFKNNIDLNLDKEKPSSIDYSAEDGDSDDSLGILPLNIFVDKEEIDESYFDILLTDPLLMSDNEESFSTNQNTKNISKKNSLYLKNAVPISTKEQGSLNVTQIIDSPKEQGSLNITQIIDSPKEQGSLNVTQIIDSPKEQESLNVTQVFDSPKKQGSMNVTQVIHSPKEQGSLNVTQAIGAPKKQSNMNVIQVIDSLENQDNLNLTQVIDLLVKPDNLNVTQVINSPEEQSNLLITEVVHSSQELCDIDVTVASDDCTIEQKFKKVEKTVSVDIDLSSPVSVMLEKHPISKSESPIGKIASSPKYASTPKHETNYTFTLDDEFLNLEKKYLPVSHLNKTTGENAIKEKAIFIQSDELDHEKLFQETAALSLGTDEQNILNITCNVQEPSNDQCELNKTYENVFSHAESIPVTKITDALFMDTIKLPKELENKTFSLKEYKTDDIKDSGSYNKENIKQDNSILRNVLSTTVSSLDETLNLEEIIDSNAEVSGFLLEKKLDYEDCKSISGNTLNTTISKGFKTADVKDENNKQDHSQVLNTTYEKIDQLTEMPTFSRASQVENQEAMKDSKNQKISKIARRINSNPHTTVVPNVKCTEFTEKKFRKSVFFPSKIDSRSELEKQNLNRRRTLGCVPSKRDKIHLSQNRESASNYVQKQSCTTSDSKSLKIPTSSSCDMSKKDPIKEKINTESISKFVLRKPRTKISNIPSSLTPQTCLKIEEAGLTIESELNKKQTSHLDEAINVTEKTAFSKHRLPPKRISSVKSEIPRSTQENVKKISFIPAPKQVKKTSLSTIGDQDKKTILLGLPEKQILVQRNIFSSSHAYTSSAITSRRQSFSRQSSISGAVIDPDTRKLKPPLTSESKKKNAEKSNLKPSGPEKQRIKSPCRNLR